MATAARSASTKDHWPEAREQRLDGIKHTPNAIYGRLLDATEMGACRSGSFLSKTREIEPLENLLSTLPWRPFGKFCLRSLQKAGVIASAESAALARGRSRGVFQRETSLAISAAK